MCCTLKGERLDDVYNTVVECDIHKFVMSGQNQNSFRDVNVGNPVFHFGILCQSMI